MLDERVRDAVDLLDVHVAPDPPPFDDVLAARRRRRAVRTAVVVVVVVVAAATATAVSLLGRDRSPSTSVATAPDTLPGDVVPWVDRPALPFIARPIIPTVPPRADARPCRPADVTLAPGEGDGAGGHLAIEVQFKNVSSTPCLLQGYPDVNATEPGRPPVTATHGSFFPDPQVVGNMAPGGTSIVLLETDSYCQAHQDGGGPSLLYHRAVFTFGGGTREVSASLDVKCGLFVTRFGLPMPQLTYGPLPMASLRPTLELPARAKAGEILHYVVVLSNPTDEEIALDPCPGYLQIFGPLTEGHSLNCDEAPTVPAHGRVRFAMQLRLPSGIAGRFTLHWDFNVEGDANASGSVTVS